MKLMFDLDGVFANFIRALNAVALELYPNCLESPDVVPQHYFYKDLLHEDQIAAVLLQCQTIENFWYFNVKPYLDSVEALKSVDFRKHDIYFVTARFNTPGWPTTFQTRLWIRDFLTCGQLRRDAFNVIQTVDSSFQKRRIATAIQAEFSIDDKPENVRKLSSVPEHYSWLLDRPYNRFAHDLDDFRVSSVAEFLRKIELD